MGRSHYLSYDERQKIAKDEEKLTLKLSELSSVKCPHCSNKILRVFLPKGTRAPAFRQDATDYMRRMQKTMARCVERGDRNVNYIAGPEYTLVFSAGHFTKPHSDNLGDLNSNGHCGSGAFIGESHLEIVSRYLLRSRTIRQACMVNGVKPQAVRDWLSTLTLVQMSGLMGWGFRIVKVPETDLHVGFYKSTELDANTVSYDVEAIAGPEWAAELDPVMRNAPPHKGSRGKYIMSPTHGAVQYTKNAYKPSLAFDLPDGLDWYTITDTDYGKVIDVELPNGTLAKLKISHKGAASGRMSQLSRKLDEYKAPRDFYVVRADVYRGSSEIHEGDLVL